MKMTLRWFGANSDTVTLKQIRQIPGVMGVMGFLDYKAAGEVWDVSEIAPYIAQIEAAGLKCPVIESVNVHEDIKLGAGRRDEWLSNYIQTIHNLAAFGVKVIIYNFMPVFDWLRTDLARLIPEDGSNSLYFNEADLGDMGPLDIVRRTMKGSDGFTLPGWEPERLSELEKNLAEYEGVTQDVLRANYKYFLDAVIPACEQADITLACHPDDPAWPIFGLPRIAYDIQCLQKIIELHPSKRHALCICTGSLASNRDNDIRAIIRRFGGAGRVACLHIRNVKHLGYRHFREAAHLSSEGDLDMYEIVRAMYDACPEVYVRPDHGRMIWDEKARPGYGLYDRALGAAYINGLWEAVGKEQRLTAQNPRV